MDNGGSFGFNGEQSRGFDLPAGVLVDFTIGPAPKGRARFRYNDVAKAVEISVDGGGYAVVTTGSATSPWVEIAGVVRPQNVTDDVVIGDTALVGAETLRVVGDVRIEPDDTAGGLNVVNGGGNTVLSATQAGVVTLGSANTNIVQFGSTDATGARVGPSGSPNINFVAEVDHYLSVDQSSTGVVGAQFSIFSAWGGNASGGGVPAGNGGPLRMFAGWGGDGSGADAAGDGAIFTIDAGPGGQGTALVVGGNGGNVSINGGPAGASGGAGAGTKGSVSLAGSTIGLSADTTDGVAADGIQYIVSTTPSAPTANAGTVYTRDVAATAELFFYDEGGNDVQLTTSGAIGGVGVTFDEQPGDPGGVANQGKLYTKDVAGVTELFYQRSNGTVLQLS